MNNLKKNLYAFFHLLVGGGMMLVSGLFLVIFVLMANSESWQEKLLRESVQVETDKVNRANNGKLVCFTTIPEVSEALSDPEFGVAIPNIVRLKRVVEMLQWKEKRTRLSGKTTRTM